MDKSAVGAFIRNDLPDNITISIYVDDFIISSNNEEELLESYENLVSAIEKAGFLLNNKKSHRPQLKSTAFNIKISQYEMAIEDDRFNIFYEDISLEERKKTEAIIAYVDRVCPPQSLKLTRKLENLKKMTT